jgi:hypothetical protein
MTSSSFRWLFLSLILSAAPLRAQEPAAPSPAAAAGAAKKPKEGYVRFWNMLSKQTGEFSLVQETGADAASLLSAAPNNYYASYVPFKPGRYALKVIRSADPKTSIKTFDLILRSDVYVTFYAHMADGVLAVEMLDDTYDRAKTDAGSLTIRQLYPGVKVTVRTSVNSASRPLEFGQVDKLDGLPLKPVFLQMEAALPGGRVRKWATEVNFSGCRHASLLLVQDPYGRFRPRISPDGQAEFTEPAE